MQLAGIGFAGAQAQVAYLHELGIETLYVSPILAAAPGSTHGYDVIDPCRLEASLGTADELEALLAELAAHRMRLLVDIVPNHMAAHPSNRWWWEVLRDGQASEFASFFDIDWNRHRGRVMVPTLSRPLAEVRAQARTIAVDDLPVLELDGQLFPFKEHTGFSSGFDTIIDEQHYRPAYWRLSRHEGNYRRFFDIDGLIGVRVEDPHVFERTHELIADLCADERVAGVRVDHVDGLTDPSTYLERLRAALAGRSSAAVVLVEKILARDETLHPRWPVDGTTGYEFANLAGGLFVQEQGARALAEVAEELTGETQWFGALLHEGKREALAQSFPAPLDRLGRLALAALDIDEPGHDLSLADICEAWGEMTVHLEVYRTYLDTDEPEPTDRERLDKACTGALMATEARRAMKALRSGLLEKGASARQWLEVAQRWQQLTGAVMAKGVEDTATFRYSGLLSHAEVGCDPDHSSASPSEFHGLARTHLSRSASLNATSTHDSKRNEEARARLFVLSEAAKEWAALLRRWHRRHAKWRDAGPDTHDELAAYQALVALWPFDVAELSEQDCRRVQDYGVKATREAKWRTTWVDPNPDYEKALDAFIGTVARDRLFAREMRHFLGHIAPAAVTNSLGLVVLKAVCPGVPDFYQGTELFEPTLTDPDNRQPVDYDSRRRLLSSLPPIDAPASTRAATVQALLDDRSDGRIKLFTMRALLHLRRDEPSLFDKGSYDALQVRGSHCEHVVALARRHRGRVAIALVPRLTLQIAGPGRFPTGPTVWGDTEVVLPDGVPTALTDLFTGDTFYAAEGLLRVGDALRLAPVSVLTSP
jgi:malto-oligosyltrehalose synthase